MRQLKSYLRKKKSLCNNECRCLLLSARRDYELNWCNCEDWFYPIPTSITLSKTEATLVSWETDTIIATVLPAEAAKFYPVVWTSSDDTIATVNDWVISFVKWWYATITATSNTISETVSVFCDVPVTKIVVDKDTVELDIWETETITATVSPVAARPLHPVVWTSDDEEVATVDNWVITYVWAGTATITATAWTKSTTVEVTCKAPSFPYLCFTANEENSSIKMDEISTTELISLETSLDWTTWADYTVWNTITLANIWDKVYWRNKSETATNVQNYFFVMTWSVSASGDLGYILCKNSTDTIANPLGKLFRNCESLTSAPELPATNLCVEAYHQLFEWCINLGTLPSLPATTLAPMCYDSMFSWCSNIKLSETQTWEYQTPYRIPTEWTWVDEYGVALSYMFGDTWWTFTWTPEINTTYYTSNTVI